MPGVPGMEHGTGRFLGAEKGYELQNCRDLPLQPEQASSLFENRTGRILQSNNTPGAQIFFFFFYNSM